MKLDVTKLSILAWLKQSGLKSEKGEPLVFHDRLFWLDILADWNPSIVIKGAAQIGKSVNFTLKVLYAMRNLGISFIYSFPTDSDVREFVASKVNPLIRENRHVFGEMDSDNIERKEFGGRFVHFKGTISKTAGISTTADCVIHDEASRSDRMTMETMRSRTKSSTYRGRWIFSNPTTDGDEVEEEWKKSDQKEWHVKCPSCGTEQMMTWPDSVDLERRIYVCTSCRAEMLDEARRKGRWVAGNPGSTTSGYHLSHLICPWINAGQVIDDSERGEEYFNNFVLGEPYTPSVLAITRNLILDAWTPHSLVTGKYFMGVDVGSIKHYVLGSEKGVIKIGRFGDWADLDELVKAYDPITVIDAMPENEISRAYVSQNPKFSMCYLGRDKESNEIAKFGKGTERGVIKADRNRLIDYVVSRLQQGELQFHVPADSMFRLLLKHCETMRKVKEIDAKGNERFCFVAGTKVLTELGEKNIESIKIGDRVLTRGGYRRVINTMDREAEVVDTGVLCGTPNHPVFTNRGLQSLLSIPLCDRVFICHPKRFSTKVLNLLDTLTQKVTPIETTIETAVNRADITGRDFIRWFIRITLAIFQRVLLFITKTIIRLTILQKTWNYCIKKNTSKSISQNFYQIPNGQKDEVSRQQKKCSVGSRLGEERMKLKSFLLNILRKIFTLKAQSTSFANGAGKNARPITKEVGSSVVNNAVKNGTQGITGIQFRKERVYNLTIQDIPEYFANGVLVHNCWQGKTPEDHLLFGLCFFELARFGADGNSIVIPEYEKRPEAIIETDDGGWKLNLEEHLKYPV